MSQRPRDILDIKHETFIRKKGNSVSAIKHKNLQDEFSYITRSLGKKYHKYCHTKTNSANDDSFFLGYQHWNQWLKKHKVSVSAKLTKREFKAFWHWFKARKDDYANIDYSNYTPTYDGIRIDKVIDDFVNCGVMTRTVAITFVKSIDADNNGSISFEEFMNGLSKKGDLEHIMSLRKFVSQLSSEEVDGSQKKGRARLDAASLVGEVGQKPHALPAIATAQNSGGDTLSKKKRKKVRVTLDVSQAQDLPHLSTGRREESSISRTPKFSRSRSDVSYFQEMPAISPIR
jgi:hypothetical protein